MAIGGNNVLGCSGGSANGTLLTLGQAGFGTGGSLSCQRFLGVAGSGSFGLRYKNVAAGGALLALSQAGLGAGCGLAGYDFFNVVAFGAEDGFTSAASVGAVVGVASSGNLVLSYSGSFANGTLLAVSQAGLGAGCGLASNGFLGVAVSGNDVLLNSNSSADRALLALSQAGFGAGGSLTGKSFLGVALSGNDVLLNSNSSANGALLTFGQTGFNAGCGLASNGFLGVAGGLLQNCLTYGAGLISSTGSGCAGLMTQSFAFGCTASAGLGSGAGCVLPFVLMQEGDIKGKIKGNVDAGEILAAGEEQAQSHYQQGYLHELFHKDSSSKLIILCVSQALIF